VAGLSKPHTTNRERELSNTQYKNLVVALGAAFLSARLVQDIACNGRASEPELELLLNGILNTNPDSVDAVYDDADTLNEGFKILSTQFSKTKVKDPELLRYLISLLALEKKLSKRKDMLEYISKRIDKAKDQADHFGLTHENVVANFADIYTETLSKFKLKVQVMGNPAYLTNKTHQNKVRAVLLAGIRAIVLWRQSGGSRLHLIFNRQKYLDEAEKLLKPRLHLV